VSFPIAFAIGFSIASVPGPTIILIATETLRSGARAGLFAIVAPVLIDATVMVPLGFLLQTVMSNNGARALGLAGGLFLFWLGFKSIRARQPGSTLCGATPAAVRFTSPFSSFARVAVAHLTSPYPYLYWGTVGGALMRKGIAQGGLWEGMIFPLGFWLGTLTFTGTTVYLIARGRRLLPARFEPVLHIFSGALLITAALLLVGQVFRDWA
jgi:threonine/homoserine/homoserine lactone efflux protein